MNAQAISFASIFTYEIPYTIVLISTYVLRALKKKEGSKKKEMSARNKDCNVPSAGFMFLTFCPVAPCEGYCDSLSICPFRNELLIP